jgi:hypothetical protein
MTDYERETRVVRDDGTAEVRETVVDDTAGERITVVREGGNATAWIIAAMVAVVAIIIIAMLMMNEPADNAEDLAAAMDASRAAGYVEGANTAAMSQPPLTTTIPVPVPVDSGAAERSAADAAASAEAAREAAERAAESVAGVTTNTTP